MKKIAVIFPGIGYHADKPLLYYSSKLAGNYGYEIIKIGYPPCEVNLKEASSEQIASFVEECMKTVKDTLSDVRLDTAEDILFISKSIGTAVAACYANAHGLPARHVYFTPLEDTFSYTEPKSGIAFCGTADPWADHEHVRKLCKKNDIPLTVIEGVNHSLESRDVTGDIKNLRKVMKAVDTYIMGKDR